jgi:hypothetical protein
MDQQHSAGVLIENERATSWLDEGTLNVLIRCPQMSLIV